MVRKTKKSAARVARVRLLKRATPTREVMAAAVSRLERTIGATIESELASAREIARHLDNISAPIGHLIATDRRALASAKALYKTEEKAHVRRIDAIRKGNAAEALTAFNFTANPGWQVLTPPYDVGWQTGAAFSDKLEGDFTILVGDGFSAAALGVFLSVTKRSLVRIRPIAPFEYNWGNIAFSGPAFSQGGVGMLGYRNRDAQPFLDRRGSLWKDKQLPPNSGNGSGSGQIANELYGDVLVAMEPGNTYLIWTWAWGSGFMRAEEGRLSLSMAAISCRVPLIVVDAGPAPPVVK